MRNTPLSRSAFLAALLLAPAAAQTTIYDSGGFEAPTFVPGQLADTSLNQFGGIGQDDWIATANIGDTVDQSLIFVQNTTTAGGSQAVTLEAAGQSVGFLHLRRNVPYAVSSNPTEPVVDIHMRLRVDDGSTRSDAWTIQAQAGPATGIFAWGIHADDHVYYSDPVSGQEVDTGFVVQRGVWYSTVTSIDYASSLVTVHFDGVPIHTGEGYLGILFNAFAFSSVALFAPGTDSFHMDDYRLTTRPEGPLPGGLGSSYCVPTALNSVGAAASLEGVGSPLVSDQDVRLIARDLPQNAFGFFITSRTQGNVVSPGGSQGTLCLGGAIGRYQNAVMSSGVSGRIELQLDLMAMPDPMQGPVAVAPGDTWNFQAWYRDANPGPTSNFTAGLSVTFQ